MTRRKASYCPYCGTALETRPFDGRDRRYCDDCGEFVFQNPAPVAGVVVRDGTDVLLVKRGIDPDRGAWSVPAGFLEVDESARVGAARELEEETGLSVNPDELALAHTGFEIDDPDDGSLVSVCFAIERDETAGVVRPGEEPSDARFRDADALLAGEFETRSIDQRRVAAALDAVERQSRQPETRE